jgi:NTE family protein
VYVSTVQKITAKDLRSIKAVTTRAFELLVANSNLQKFNNCDWLIEPDELSSFNTFETNKAKMDQIFEIGYQAAKKSFESLAG